MSVTEPFLVIFLHGVGSNGANMIKLGNIWQNELPWLRFAAPDGIMVGPQGYGRAWFSIAGVTDRNRANRVYAARAAFDELIVATVNRAGFGGRLGRVALVGFSQGSMMALDAVVSGRWPVSGVLAYSGRLATQLPFQVSQTRICLIHGDADQVISVKETHKADDILRTSGFNVTTTILPNVDHYISADGIKAGRNFIANFLL